MSFTPYDPARFNSASALRFRAAIAAAVLDVEAALARDPSLTLVRAAQLVAQERSLLTFDITSAYEAREKK